MATKAIEKAERTLADVRQELWEGSEELFQQFLASIAEQAELTPEQQGVVGDYLAGTIEKRDRLAHFILQLDETAAMLREREKRLADRRHEYESLASMFRGSILAHLQNNPAGIVKRVDGMESSFRVKANPPKVEIVSETELPGEFINYVPQPDKRAIKEALESGKEVPGARIGETTYHLDIR